MRPELLNPLFTSIERAPGIGPKLITLFAKLLDISLGQEIVRFIDLLFLMPHEGIDRPLCDSIHDVAEGQIATLVMSVDRHFPPPLGAKKAPYRIHTFDKTGSLQLVFFYANRDWLEKQFPPNQAIAISGKVEWFNGQATMVHPDYAVLASDIKKIPLLEGVYPLTAGLSPKILHRAIHEALGRCPVLPEWLEESLKAQEKFPSFNAALRCIHKPSSLADLEINGSARSRLAYDELLAGQLTLALMRGRTRNLAGRSRPAHNLYTRALRTLLPFPLTKGQESVLRDISEDLASNKPMLRLLQGDVGAGKTVLAFLAMAQVAENGGQAALMTPTEILARQHFSNAAPLFTAIGLKTVLLTGREKGKVRTRLLEEIKTGVASFIIGTHALFQDTVTYHDLALAIIDEQHRFGVEQRLELAAKGQGLDLLVMTATPIPRTLVLTNFGDMDISQLTEKPKTRQAITTAAVALDQLDTILNRVDAALSRGEKLYWVCPLVDESESLDLTAARKRYEQLHTRFGDRVGLLHGKMSTTEKDAAMAAFHCGQTQLLVATTVVEVGVDVHDASIIIIEHAERFGLSQLHQLRGRVGRGATPAACLLLYKSPLSKTATQRLKVIRQSQDGFYIAEEDLRIRGEGELLGTRQSGLPDFKIADLSQHGDLLVKARQDARLILEKDPMLTSERGQALRLLLYLFRHDSALRLLRSG
ncbi:ATP-dependent DNA helicase RecG [Bartonella sp. DGB2]|uniref:ATP-dependent DNA helicase RecG n=1 Tax=Bartonella sp. DGB2 TaxID=3388426 RepID=UPI00398FDFA0